MLARKLSAHVLRVRGQLCCWFFKVLARSFGVLYRYFFSEHVSKLKEEL